MILFKPASEMNLDERYRLYPRVRVRTTQDIQDEAVRLIKLWSPVLDDIEKYIEERGQYIPKGTINA